jgi:hypothetical protein
MTLRLICTTPTAELAWAFGAANEATTATPELVPGPRGLAPLIRSDRSGLRSAPVFRRVLAVAPYGALLLLDRLPGQPKDVRREEERGEARREDLLTDRWHEFHGVRCIVPAAGYFESFAPQPCVPEPRHAHAVRPAAGGTMALAGLLDPHSWDRAGGVAVVTVPCADPDAAPHGEDARDPVRRGRDRRLAGRDPGQRR